MAEKIKGITVEIGGDTGPLQNALKSANDTSVALQKELREIDRALKFDPGNVDLLTQKQTVLSQAVENTAKKLETLRDVDIQLQEKAKSGEISAEQYRSFQRELIATENSLNNSSAELSKLSSSAGAAANEMGGLSGVVDGFTNMLGIKLPPQISNAIKGFDATGASGKKLGDQVSALANNLGVKLSPSVSSAISGLGGLSAGALAAGAAIVVATKALIDMAMQGAQAADNIATNATIMGVTNQRYQEFVAISDLVDTSAETIGSSMSKLTRSMGEAQNGSEKTQKAFKRLGVSFHDDVTGALRDNEQVFYEVIDALGRMKNQTERDALAMDILGKSARDLNPLIAAGSAKMREFSEYAHAHGIIMSDEMTDAYNELADAMDWSKQIGEGLKNTLGSIVTPSLTTGIETFNDLLGDTARRLQDAQLAETLKSIFNILGDIIHITGTILNPILDTTFRMFNTMFAYLNLIIAPLEWTYAQISAIYDLLSGNAEKAEQKAREANEKIAASYKSSFETVRKSVDSLLGTNFAVQESAKEAGKVIGDSFSDGYARGAEAAEKERMTLEEANAAIAKSREEAKKDARSYYVVVADEHGRLSKIHEKDYALYEKYAGYINEHYASLSEKQKVQLAKQLEAQQQAQGKMSTLLTAGAKTTEAEAHSNGKGIGLSTTDGISKGLEAGIPKVEQSTRKVVKAINDEFTKGLDIHSPSRKGYGWGENTLEGFIRGFDSKTTSLKSVIGKALDGVNALSQGPRPLLQGATSSGQFSTLAIASGGALSKAGSTGGGDVYHITIDAKNVQEFNDIVRIAQSTPQRRRSGQRREGR